LLKPENINTTVKFPPWAFYLIVVVISIIPLFYNLGGPVLNLWDESRRAVNAWEMYENSNFLVTHFNGEPEMWGTKPPLLIWLQTLSMHIFGLNEFALRFPSALSGLLLGFLILWFTRYYANSYGWGIVSILILYTSHGFINAHSVRTGDFDAILVLFTTAASLFLFLGTEAQGIKLKRKFILLFFIMLTLAAMTKGIAAFILGPAYLIYLVFRKDLYNWLRNRNTWIGTGILVFVVAGFYLLRDLLNPGYLRAMIENEITGRYFDTLEQNRAPFTYYLRLLYQLSFKNMFFLIPLGIILGYFSKDLRIKRILSYMLLLTGVFLLIISVSETKLMWYSLPVFPFLALMAGVFFTILFRLINSTDILVKSWKRKGVLHIVIVIFFFASPYFRILKQNQEMFLPSQNEETHSISHFLRDVERGNIKTEKNQAIAYEGEFQHFLFYVYKLNDAGYNIEYTEWENAKPGTTYLVYQDEVLDSLEMKYDITSEPVGESIYKVRLW
jgi:4-amino-4-deoxy-L-arabinose transferase-like glycosyltransferase